LYHSQGPPGRCSRYSPLTTILAETGGYKADPNDYYSEFSVATLWDLLGEERGDINGSTVNGYSGNNRYSVVYLPGTRLKNGGYDWNGKTTWKQITDLFDWTNVQYKPFPHGIREKKLDCQLCNSTKGFVN